MTCDIIPLTVQDWPAVADIYRQGIATGNATFETDIPDWTEWDKKHRPDCRLVAKKGLQVLGWAALSPVSTRSVYHGVAEVSIYVSEAARGTGIGKTLLEALITEAESSGVWTLQAGIFPENIASIALHKACGFRIIGCREKLGRMNGCWRDVLLLERRSRIVGVENL